jgi:hypothetical protein
MSEMVMQLRSFAFHNTVRLMIIGLFITLTTNEKILYLFLHLHTLQPKQKYIKFDNSFK